MSYPNYDEMARLLGVSRTTLPASNKIDVSPREGGQTGRQGFSPLTGEEFVIIQPRLPRLPVPKTAFECDDRIFLNAALWFIESKARGNSWHRLPPQYWPRSSRQNRYARWALFGYWQTLFEKLKADGRLSEARLGQFDRIAADAAMQQARIMRQRERANEP